GRRERYADPAARSRAAGRTGGRRGDGGARPVAAGRALLRGARRGCECAHSGKGGASRPGARGVGPGGARRARPGGGAGPAPGTGGRSGGRGGGPRVIGSWEGG